MPRNHTENYRPPASPPSEFASEAKPAHVFSEKLEPLSGEASATHAVILVGGIHSNHDYFEKWVPALSGADTVVLGFDHNHRAMTMKEAAASLADSIGELKGRGITDITIVAHSMGGLVAKGAVDEMSRTGAADSFNTLDLHALGTPWGGFAIADLARYTPGSESISNAIGFPMGPEIGPGSDYMQSLAKPMPQNGEFHVYKGDVDTVSTPEMDSTKARYDSIERNATSATELVGFKHNDYSKAPPELLDSTIGKPVPGYDTQIAMASNVAPKPFDSAIAPPAEEFKTPNAMASNVTPTVDASAATKLEAEVDRVATSDGGMSM